MSVDKSLEDEAFINAVADRVIAEIDRRRELTAAQAPIGPSVTERYEAIREVARRSCQSPNQEQ
jgi:hypothetical protein